MFLIDKIFASELLRHFGTETELFGDLLSPHPRKGVVSLGDMLKVHSREGTAVAQWLRCCATNRNVAGSIPAGVIGIFH